MSCDPSIGNRWRHAPYDITDIVGNEQRALLVDHDTDRSAQGVAFVVEETSQDIDWQSARPAIV